MDGTDVRLRLPRPRAHPPRSPPRIPDVNPFERLGRFVVRRAWWVVGAWAILLLVALPLAPQVPGAL